MKGTCAKISSIALSILLLNGCEVFSEKKMNAYVGDSYEEYSRSYDYYAYAPEGAHAQQQGGYYHPAAHMPLEQQTHSAW